MPKIKKQNVSGIPIKRIVPEPEREIIKEEDIFREPTNEEIQDAEKLEDLQSRFGGQQYKIRIEKYNKETSEMEIVDRVALDNFDPFLIGKLYKGGRFVCKLYNEKGKYVEGGYMTFNFAEKVEETKALSALQDPMVVMLIENLKNQNAQTTELLKAMMVGSSQKSPISEVIAAVKGVQDLSPKEQKENPLKALKELFELQALIKGKSDDDGDEKSEGIKGIFSEAVEALKVLNQSRAMPRPIRPGQITPKAGIAGGGIAMGPIVMRTPSGHGTPSSEASEKQPTNVGDPVLKKLLPHIPIFEEAAMSQESPEKWASYLIDVLDTQVVPAILKKYPGVIKEDGVWELLISAAEDDEKIANIYSYAPTLQVHHEWVVQVLREAVRQFDDTGEIEPEAPEPVSTTVNGTDE